jgi:tetratricopeptide (TPR) repeat protein
MARYIQEGKMIRRFGLFIAVACFFVAVGVPLSGQTAADFVRQGDAFYAQFKDAQALDEYLKAAQAEPESYEALWKTSRAYFDVADSQAPADSKAADEQRKIYGEAMDYARRAIKVDPKGSWGHFFLSAAWGKFVMTQGKKEQVDASKQIRVEIDKAIEADPNNDLAYHALALWNRRMAEIGGAQRFFGGLIYGGIPKGTFEEAEKNLKKAIELNPNYTNHHLELGRTYLSMKKPDLAKQEFQKTLGLPDTTSKCPKHKKEAQAELDALSKKGK